MDRTEILITLVLTCLCILAVFTGLAGKVLFALLGVAAFVWIPLYRWRKSARRHQEEGLLPLWNDALAEHLQRLPVKRHQS